MPNKPLADDSSHPTHLDPSTPHQPHAAVAGDIKTPHKAEATTPIQTDIQPAVETTANAEVNATTEVYRPQKTQVLYTTLIDTSPIQPQAIESKSSHHHAELSSPQSTPRPTPNKPPQVIFDTAKLNPPSPYASTNISSSASTLPPHTATDNDPTATPTEVLTKTHKSETLTDRNILTHSHQILPTDDRLANDNSSVGHMIEHLGVATRQWEFTVNWERTQVPKSGFINQLKKKTETLDLDLSCLLCNRYGEVIERVWFKNMRDQAESVRHRGDELLGSSPELPANIDATADHLTRSHDRKFHQERISIYFSRIPPHIFQLVLLISSYQPAVLNAAQHGVCQLLDDEGNVITEMALNQIKENCSALQFATLTRSADSWRYHAGLTALTAHKMADIEKAISDTLVRTAK